MAITKELPADWLLPDPTWSVAEGFWSGVQRGALCFPKCEGCGTFAWYPQPRCGICGSHDYAWTEVDTHGEIFSFAILRRAFLPQLVDRIPHGVVLVRFPDVPGVTLVSMLAPGEDPETLDVGQQVEVVFEPTGDDGLRLPCVRRTR